MMVTIHSKLSDVFMVGEAEGGPLTQIPDHAGRGDRSGDAFGIQVRYALL